MDALSRTADNFRRFAEVECSASPLYRGLSLAIAEDPDLLALAAAAPPGQPRPNLFLGAVHYLLMQDASHPLARHYPSLSPEATADGDPVPAFRSFALEQAPTILTLMATRRVQTNEVARASCLLPALAAVAHRNPGRPLALAEVGASAGLLLLWDQYGYRFADGLEWGPAESLQLTCELRGNGRPPLPDRPLQVCQRIGLDLNPLDVTNPDDALWLQALIWPDQPWRAARLHGAIAAAQLLANRAGAHARVRLLAGDALETLPSVLANSPEGSLRCVFHCHTLNQFDPPARERFSDILAEASRETDVHQIALEYAAGAQWPDIIWTRYAAGRAAERLLLGRYQAHGQWLEWLAQAHVL